MTTLEYSTPSHLCTCNMVLTLYGELEKLKPLRVMVYHFLRALCFTPLTTQESRSLSSKHEAKSGGISIPFVKLLCYIAKQTNGDLKSTLTFERPYIVEVRNNGLNYRGSCILCPRPMVGLLDWRAGVSLSREHLRVFHMNAQSPFGTLVADEKEVNSKLRLTLEQYFVKLQQSIASCGPLLATLDLKNEAYWFKNCKRY